jgi:hypothetical protein
MKNQKNTLYYLNKYMERKEKKRTLIKKLDSVKMDEWVKETK